MFVCIYRLYTIYMKADSVGLSALCARLSVLPHVSRQGVTYEWFGARAVRPGMEHHLGETGVVRTWCPGTWTSQPRCGETRRLVCCQRLSLQELGLRWVWRPVRWTCLWN
jgi:hypothetical protein